VPDVFAAGDLVTGPSLVVTAIGGGRRAARSIHYYLMKGQIPIPANLVRQPMPHSLFKDLEGVGQIPRVEIPEICAAERVCDFREVEHTISEAQLRHEAARCMRCGSSCYDEDDPGRMGLMSKEEFEQAREAGRVVQ